MRVQDSVVPDDRQLDDSVGRATKIARLIVLILLFLISASLVAFWLRSHKTADRLHGRLWGRNCFLIASKQGRLIIVGFLSQAAPGWWKWEMRSYPVDDELSFPFGDVKQYETWPGVGIIRNPLYLDMRSTVQRPDGTTIMVWGAATTTLRGWGVIIPFWLVVATATLSMMVLALRRLHYSIRTLLIAVGLFAFLLAAIRLLQ